MPIGRDGLRKYGKRAGLIVLDLIAGAATVALGASLFKQ